MRDTHLVIYPTARKVEDQLTRLSRDGSLLGYRITTMPQVVDALWNETVDRRGRIDALGERLVMREALARVTAQEPRIEIATGTADRMLGLIRQLKSARIDHEDWTIASAVIGPRSVGLEPFARSFAAYQGILDERVIADGHDRAAAVLDLLLQCERAGTRPRYLEGVAHLLVAEIYDLSLLQFMLIAAMIRIVGDAELTIQAAPRKVDASRFADLTWNRFVGEESIADQVLPDFVRREGRSGRLGFLLEQIFTEDPPSPPPPDETVAISEAPDPRAEADEVARTIRRLCDSSERPLDPGRIAIVARDITLYRDHLEAAFRGYGIPLRIASGQALRGTMPVRAMLAIASIPLGSYHREELSALCDNSLIEHPISSARGLLLEIGYVDETTRSVRECLELRREELLEALRIAEDAETRRPIDINLARLQKDGATWMQLLEAFRRLETAAPLVDHLAHLRALLERLDFDPARARLDDAAAHATGALWSTLDALADNARRIAPCRELSAQDFSEALEGALRDAELEASLPTGPGVQVLSVMDARGLDFDQIFLLGMNEGVFPQQHPDNPLLPDELVRELNPRLRERLRRKLGADAPDALGPIIRTRADRNAEEPFLFFLALSMPAQQLVLSYAAEDEQGKPLGPSPYLSEVRRLLAWDTGGRRARRSGAIPGSPDDCLTERDYLNWAALHGWSIEPPAADPLGARTSSVARRIAIERERASYFALSRREERLARWQKDHAKEWATPEALEPDSRKMALAGRHTGRVASGDALVEFLTVGATGAPRRWSATQFSELAQCGFKFFARRLLRLRNEDDADEEQSRLEVGTIVHRVLRVVADARLDYSQPDGARRRAREITRRIETLERGKARDPAFFDVDWVSIQKMIDEVVGYECDRHASGERTEQSDAEYRLDFKLEGRDATPITIEGAIDRLEITGGGENVSLRVIDYKTSGNLKRLGQQLKPASFATTDLQLPIYLLGANTQAVQGVKNLIAEAAYIALKSRAKATAALRVPSDRIDPKQITHQPGEAIAVAARLFDLLDAARAGHFDVDPLECSTYCPYRQLCRVGTASQA